MKSTRRKFIQGAATLISAPVISSFSPVAIIPQAKSSSPAEKITVALIGARGRGYGVLRDALKQKNVTCAAICDIDDSVLRERTTDVEKIQGSVPQQFKDFRKLLERKDIDAVIIGTPDHWHCLPMVYACQSGKDVYVEKPLANSIAECAIMEKAARKYNRVVQVGMQQRSADVWNHSKEYIKSGEIGRLRKVLVWANFNYGLGTKRVPDEPVPEGVDFDMWLGPAPKRSFNRGRFHGNWRMFWDYGGGLLTDWGVHLMDMALWIKDIKEHPVAVQSSGGNWGSDEYMHETFDTLSVNYQMKDYLINWQNTAGTEQGPYGMPYGLAYICDKGTLVINRSGWEVYPESENGKPKVPPVLKQEARDNPGLKHMENFIDCIRNRKDPVCNVEEGSLVAQYTHMGNISLRAGGALLRWDTRTGRFLNNPEANALIKPNYQNPWKFPVV